MKTNQKRRALILVVMLWWTSSLSADLKYEEVTKMTGGLLEGFTKVAGFFGAKDLNTSTATYIKGDRLRTDNLSDGKIKSSQIIQLDKEQIVEIDHQHKTYSVMTFAEIQARMQKAMEEMKKRSQEKPAPTAQQPPKDSDVKVEPKIDVKETGETKIINGFNTKRVILSVMFEGEDQKTKEKGALGTNMDLWLTKDLTALKERNQFYQRYAEKMARPMMESVGASPQAMAQDPRMMESMEALKKKAKALDGEAVMTVTSFALSGTPGDGTQPQATSRRSEPKTAQKDSDSNESVGQAIGKALGGGFGGFGGFGRKKKKESAPPPETTSHSSSADAGPVNASLMTMTTELKSFSQGSIDPSVFEVPSGFKLEKK